MKTIATTVVFALAALASSGDFAADLEQGFQYRSEPSGVSTDINPCDVTVVSGCADPLPWTGSYMWRGFDHEWRYNHRLNRLGDFIKKTNCDDSGCEATAVHTAASGKGDDMANYTSFNTFVSTDSARFWYKKETIYLYSVEEQWVEGTASITVPTAEENSVAVLRGYDIVSISSADTLEKLTVKIINESYSRAAGEFSFDVFAGINMDCDTIECPGATGGGSASVHYKVIIYVTVIAGPSETFNHEQGAVVDPPPIKWDDYQDGFLGIQTLLPGREIFRNQFRITDKVITGIGGDEYPNAALAFRRLTVNLDKGHHMLEMDMALLPQHYDATTGSYKYDLRLFFKQWAADMSNYPSVLFPALHVLEKPGEADFKATAVLLQFATGDSTNSRTSGAFYWAGGNQSADSVFAESKTFPSASF